MIISVLCAAFGLIVLVAAALLGLNETTLVSIFLVNAALALFLAARSLSKDEEERSNSVEANEDLTSWQHHAATAKTEGRRICNEENTDLRDPDCGTQTDRLRAVRNPASKPPFIRMKS